MKPDPKWRAGYLIFLQNIMYNWYNDGKGERKITRGRFQKEEIELLYGNSEEQPRGDILKEAKLARKYVGYQPWSQAR